MLKKTGLLFSMIGAVVVFSGSQARACACCGTYRVVNVEKHDVLNIRSGPSVRYRKVGSIPAGSACVIKTGRKRGKWHQVQYAQILGWVNSRYLRFLPR